MELKKKTHREVKEPQITVQGLADYMGAASERAKRSVVQPFRYRPTVRVVRYNEGKAIAANFMRKGGGNLEELTERAEGVRSKVADTDFDVTVNESNADLLLRLVAVYEKVQLPKAELDRGLDLPPLKIGGVRVTMRPSLLIHRRTKTNKIKTGAMLYRYAKGRALPKKTGELTSVGVFGFLRTMFHLDKSEEEADRPLCVTLCGHTGEVFPALGDALDTWNDMKAACQTIAERWPNIQPPPGAVL